jgi:lipoate-protein ligase A
MTALINATLYTTGFPTAHENMEFDRTLITSSNAPSIRLYEWQTAGITYPEGRPGDSELWDIDRGARPTGGGILFHSPGAIVFSVIFRTNPDGLKARLGQVSQWLQLSLNNAGYDVQPDTSPIDPTQNRLFCKTYHNPYELCLNGEKVAAMALRRWKIGTLIQGIIHVTSNLPDFEQLGPEIRPFLSTGLGGTASEIISHLLNNTPSLGLKHSDLK